MTCDAMFSRALATGFSLGLMRKCHLLVLLVLLVGSFRPVVSELLAADTTGFAYVREDNQVLHVGNDAIELQFQKSDGRLSGLLHKSSGYDFLVAKNAYWAPLHFWASIDGKRENIFGGIAASFSYSVTNTGSGVLLTLTWDKFRISSTRTFDATATLTVEVRNLDPLTYWQVAISNREDVIIDQVDCPDLHGLGQISSDPRRDYFAFPSGPGYLARDPLHNLPLARGIQNTYPSTFATMQFDAYYSEERNFGLYMAAYDPGANAKNLILSKSDTSWMSLSISQPLAQVSHRDYRPDFRFVVGVFSGAWYGAARIYRDWGLQQPWAIEGTLTTRTSTPDWFKKLSLHQWVYTYPLGYDMNHFPIVPDVANDTSTQMDSAVAVDWIGWENVSWYVNYPEVFPPKEGYVSLESAITGIHAGGNRVMFIPNTTSYSSRLSNWITAKASAVLLSGSVPGIPYWAYSEENVNGNLSTTFETMCPTTAYWRSIINDLLLNLASRKTDIIQLDGFPVVGAQICAAPNHTHEPGGGNWWAAAYLDIFRSAKSAAAKAGTPLVFSSEGTAEPYLSLLDSSWDPFTTGWSPPSSGGYVNRTDIELIPLWHAVYHDYSIVQSGIAFLTGTNAPLDYPWYYIRGFGLALTWGEVPTTWYPDKKISAMSQTDEQQRIQYLRRIVQARSTYGSRFLIYGRMLRAPEIQVPQFRIDGAKNIPYSGGDYPPFDSPSVLSSAWKSADGDVGFVLTNISPNSVSFDLPIDPSLSELAANNRYSITLIKNGTSSLLNDNAALPIHVSMVLDPLDAAIVIVGAPIPARLVNLSVLTPLAVGETMTMGTVLGGTGTSGTKPLLVRAAGPALAQFGVNGYLPDPTMTLNYTTPTPVVAVATNNDWGGTAALSAAFASVGAFPYASANSKDAGLSQSGSSALVPGKYTVQVSDASGGSGTVIAEIYDATPAFTFTATTPRLINVSVLKQIDAGATLTAGFVIGGSTTRTVLIRAIGPGLIPLGVGGVMPDPQLTLNNISVSPLVVVKTNNDWGGDPVIAATAANVGAFAVSDPASKDAMLLVTLAAGNYTAQVSPASGTAGGLAIVEVYEVP